MTEPHPTDKKSVIAELTTAFADLAQPGELVPATPWRDLEREDLQADFAGRHWNSLDAAFLRRHADSLPLLSAAAFRFYLPAYLLAAVRIPEQVDLVPFAVVRGLTEPASDSPQRSWFHERVDPLTAPQRRAIRHALEYLSAAQPELFVLDEQRNVLRASWLHPR